MNWAREAWIVEYLHTQASSSGGRTLRAIVSYFCAVRARFKTLFEEGQLTGYAFRTVPVTRAARSLPWRHVK